MKTYENFDAWLKEHDAKVRADAERDFQNSDYWNDYLADVIKKAKQDAIDEYAHEIKESFNNEFPIDRHCTEKFFSLDDARVLVDRVSRQMKEQKNE